MHKNACTCFFLNFPGGDTRVVFVLLELGGVKPLPLWVPTKNGGPGVLPPENFLELQMLIGEFQRILDIKSPPQVRWKICV